MRKGSLFAGVVLIGLGIFFLLRNAGAISDSVSIWPPILMALGLWLLYMRLTAWWWESGGFVVPMGLIAVGGWFFLRDLGVVDRDVSVWPVILIAAGIGVLLEALPRRGRAPVAGAIEIPLDDARTARVRLDHGGGRLRVDGSAPPGMLVQGMTVGPVDREVRRHGQEVEARLRRTFRGRGWGGPGDWTLGLTGEIPLAVELRTGAGETTLDLSDIQVTNLRLETGASKTEMTLPAKGRITAHVKAGAASVTIRIPDGMAARITRRTGLSGFVVDTDRFPKTADGYESSGFDGAEHRVELDIEGGAAGFEIR
jgi:hypothetical protein